MSPDAILRAGRNCWRIASATRLAFLIDGASYFQRLHEVLQRAERSVFIVGWDIDSRLHLVREPSVPPSVPRQLGALIDRVARRRRDLQIHILVWDYAMIYAFERQAFPTLQLGWRTPRNVKVRLDGNHPLGASHHQKLVIIDDSLAFSGGMDLTELRWDTPEHGPQDTRRVTAAGEPYQPFHDVQVAVEGEAAESLGELARERWHRATGRSLRALPARARRRDLWPAGLPPDLRSVRVGIARTVPFWGGNQEVREVETLYLDSIRAARDQIYIENQFLTAAAVGAELCRSLERERGPEILIVGPQRGSGWVEQATMGVLRARMTRRLRQADRHGRLRLLCPAQDGLPEDQQIMVHAKVMIVDDRLARVGSANLSNRSMGLDSECDLAVEANSTQERQAILDLRSRLLGEHLGRPPEEVARVVAERGLLRGVDWLRGGSRSLIDLQDQVPEWLEEMVPESEAVDPERPLEWDVFVASVIPRELRRQDQAPLLTRLHLWTALSALLLAWRFTFLEQLLPIEKIIHWGIEPLRWPFDPLLAAAIYLLGALLPLNILTVLTVFLFGGAQGLAYALAGVTLASSAGLLLGRWLGPQRLRRLSRAPLDRLGVQLCRARIVTLAKARWIPITSFHLLNVVSGAWKVPRRKFWLSVVLGVFPGTLFAVLFAWQLQRTILDPHGWNGAALLLLLGAMYGLTLWLHRRFAG